MRKFLMIAALTLLAGPALACFCASDNSTLAVQTLSDPAISVADVTVRGYNTHNGQSMLQIDNIRHGSLVARDIRAKFDAQSSCGVVPSQEKMTLLIHNDSDGSYFIVGECKHSAVLQYLQVNQ